MQTFVPFPDLELCALVLDRARLGKQRIECKQLINTIERAETENIKKGWYHHLACQMWIGHEQFLCDYALEICREWKRRGYVDNQIPFFESYKKRYPDKTSQPPSWWGDQRVHLSHRSRLIEKMPSHYSDIFISDEAGMEYHWPTRDVSQ